MLKPFISFFLLGIFMVSPFVHSENQDIGLGLSSTNPEERITALWELQDDNNPVFYRKLIEITLFDKVPAVKEVAENVLRYIQSMDPEMQEKLVRIAVSDDTSENTRLAVQTILIRSYFIHMSIQEKLYRIATSHSLPLTSRQVARDILINKRNIFYGARRNMQNSLECRLAFRNLFMLRSSSISP